MESLFALQTGASRWMNNTKLGEGVSYFDFFPVGETSGLDFTVARGPVPRDLHRHDVFFPICSL